MWIRYCAYILFATLCILTSSRWLIEGARPEVASSPLSQVLGAVLTALLLASIAGRRRAKNETAGPIWPVIAGVVMVLCGPTLARNLAAGKLRADDASVALTLVPIVVAVWGSHRSNDATSDLAGELWPGLAGIAGLLLLLPEPQVAGWRGWAGLVSLPVLVGTGASMVSAGYRKGRWWALPAGALAAAGLLALTGGVGPLPPLREFPFYASALDGTLISLSLLTLTGFGERRWSAQFLVIPLLALLESVVLLRPRVDGRSWLGLGLLAAGSIRLLAGRPEMASPGSSLELSAQPGRLSQP